MGTAFASFTFPMFRDRDPRKSGFANAEARPSAQAALRKRRLLDTPRGVSATTRSGFETALTEPSRSSTKSLPQQWPLQLSVFALAAKKFAKFADSRRPQRPRSTNWKCHRSRVRRPTNDHLSDYEPSEDEEDDDLMGVAEAPPAPPASQEERPAVRLLEEMWACGCVRYVPTPLTACDAYDLQAFCSLLVDGRSSCDKLPYACIASLESVEHDVGCVEHVGRSSVEHVGQSSVSMSGGRSSMSMSVGRLGMSMSVGRSGAPASKDDDSEREGAYMPIGDRWAWVSRPRVSYDDVDGIQLDNQETEVKAVDSLQVGLLRSRPSALDLGLSSNAASVEALKMILSRAAKGPVWLASLSWQGHLSKIMIGLGLKASPLEPTLFSGWVQLGQKWTYIIALAYVDDLPIVSGSQEGVEFVYKSLSAVLKVKVTGRLHGDGQLEFLGRFIKLDGNNIAA
eukprot:s7563_g3.t1